MVPYISQSDSLVMLEGTHTYYHSNGEVEVDLRARASRNGLLGLDSQLDSNQA